MNVPIRPRHIWLFVSIALAVAAPIWLLADDPDGNVRTPPSFILSELPEVKQAAATVSPELLAHLSPAAGAIAESGEGHSQPSNAPRVSGTAVGNGRVAALVTLSNGRSEIVNVGAVVDGWRVDSITGDGVRYSKDGESVDVSIGS